MLRLALTLVGMVSLIGGSAGYAVWRGQTPMAVEPVDAAPLETAAVGEPRAEPETALLGVVVPSMEVTVSAPYEGRLASVDVVLGQRVAPGQILATLDASAAELERQAARARLRVLEAERDRVQVELASARDRSDRSRRLAHVVPEQERRQLELEVDASRARLEGARAGVLEARAGVDELEHRIEQSRLRAPFAGVVGQRHVDPGAVAQPGAPVVSLVGQGARMRLAVPSSVALRPGDELEARCEHGPARVSAVVEHVAPQIEAASRMVLVEARLRSGSPKIGTVCRNMLVIDSAARQSTEVP